MPTLNYQSWKAAKVESGECRQTIRKNGKHNPRPGQMLYHYVGARTRACRKLREDVCLSVEPIQLRGTWDVMIDGKILIPEEVRAIAQADGFYSPTEMAEWLEQTYGLPFEGILIKW